VISNRIPPSTRPTKYFLYTLREGLGRLMQCKIGHSYIGEIRRRFFPGKKVDRLCGEGFQNRYIILFLLHTQNSLSSAYKYTEYPATCFYQRSVHYVHDNSLISRRRSDRIPSPGPRCYLSLIVKNTHNQPIMTQ